MNLDNLPLLHPRRLLVEQARRDLGAFLLEFEKRHQLTTAEYLDLLVEEARSRLSSCIRSEREGSVQS